MEEPNKDEEDIILRLLRRQSYFTLPKKGGETDVSNFDLFLNSLVKVSDDGESIDAAIEGCWLPLLDPKAPVIPIKMPSYISFRMMAKKAFFIIYTYSEGEAYFEAVYLNREERFPPRSYFYNSDIRNFNLIIDNLGKLSLDIIAKDKVTTDILQIENKNIKFDASNVITKFQDFQKHIREINKSENLHRQREIINRITKEQWKTGDAGKVFIFDDYRCLVCNSQESLMNLDHKILAGELKITVALPMCSKCYQESLNYASTMEFIQRKIKEKVGIDINFDVPKTFVLERENYFKLVIQELKKRKEVKNVSKGKKDDTLNVDLGNNCLLILRLTSENNYGYMFFKNGKSIIRLDNEPHHIEKLRIGPDHIHENLIKKEDPKVSLATGSVLFDIDLIFRTIKPYLK